MNRFTKQLMAGLLSVGGMCGTFADANACGGRGGGGYHRARPVYVQPSYPSYSYAAQPWSGPPASSVRPAPRSLPPQQASQLPPTVRRLSGGAPASQPQATQFAGQQPSAPQRQAVPSQGGQSGFQPSSAATQPRVSALQSLGGGTAQLAQTPPTQQSPANRPVGNAATPAPEATSPMNEAQQSALLALAGEGDEGLAAEPISRAATTQATANTSTPLASHIGNWKASLSNGVTVELTLQADGSFSWLAVNGEKTSSFDGSYTLSGNALTLVRSSDNQKLAGQLTRTNDGGINFKLNGGKDAGLNFLRS